MDEGGDVPNFARVPSFFSLLDSSNSSAKFSFFASIIESFYSLGLISFSNAASSLEPAKCTLILLSDVKGNFRMISVDL